MNVKQMSKPKKHHYLPQFYLREFCGVSQSDSHDGKIYVYEKGRPIRISIPSAEAYENDAYSFERDGETDLTFETELARHESQVAKVLSQIKRKDRELN